MVFNCKEPRNTQNTRKYVGDARIIFRGLKKKIALFVAWGLVCSALAAEPTVTDVTAKQRYPWNGLVDITCKVSGMEEGGKGFEFIASAIMPDLGITNRLANFWVVKGGEKSTDRAVSTDGDYHLIWDAKADLGAVRYTNIVVSVTVKSIKVQLWEGGPYWATTNIGAEEPEDYGYYFWWGDTVGYKRENDKWVASDGALSNFSFDSSNYMYISTHGKDNSSLQFRGWITAEGVLSPKHDAAHIHWGGAWRMPTYQELYDLCYNKCDWTWTTMNGVNGYVVHGRGEYASNSIFFPCAGYGYGTSLVSDSYGYYWSSVPLADNSLGYYSLRLSFSSSGHYVSYNRRYLGQSVRPVQGFTK